ncbi:hypothetical protein ACWD3I_43730 [Streptomyces sp. NPDC002817]|uniref:hypothetical protein n=1 Tax=Streptomyces sp. NPDC088357 TaxID=3154655 RepID=UPI003421772B
MREGAGDREGAEDLYRQAVDHGNTHTLGRLVEMREEAGDHDGARDLARQAADYGEAHVSAAWDASWVAFHEMWPYGLDPDGTPTPPWQPISVRPAQTTDTASHHKEPLGF